jgi:hypothetical protein
MNRISFTEDWDKLQEPRFTTIRSYRPEKEAYYRELVGKTLILWRKTGRSVWNGHVIGQATLLSVEVVRPAGLPADLIRRDVLRGGVVDQEWFKRVCAMENGLLLSFENHTGILGGWK